MTFVRLPFRSRAEERLWTKAFTKEALGWLKICNAPPMRPMRYFGRYLGNPNYKELLAEDDKRHAEHMAEYELKLKRPRVTIATLPDIHKKRAAAFADQQLEAYREAVRYSALAPAEDAAGGNAVDADEQGEGAQG